MDILTQAVLGAAVAAAVAPARERRLAAGIGVAAGILPDADALIQSGSDALLVLDYHRHFSHALAFIPIGALLAALLLWPLLRRRLPFARLYAYSLAGYAFAGLLDACTSYGTFLYLPFSEAKVAWSLIAVVDPTFTLLLLVPLLISLRRPEAKTVRLGLLLALAYLGTGYLQQQRAVAVAAEVAAARGHTPQRLVVKPTMGNLILWRSLYVHGDRVYADAVHAGLTKRHYPGESAVLLGRPQSAPASAHAADIERFRRFSDDFLVQTRPGYIGDARYAMLPTTIAPIWGIAWNATGQLEFITSREMNPADRKRWLAMLLGRD